MRHLSELSIISTMFLHSRSLSFVTFIFISFVCVCALFWTVRTGTLLPGLPRFDVAKRYFFCSFPCVFAII